MENKRQYPLNIDEAYPPQSEPMFDPMKLREAYDYYFDHYKKHFTIHTFFEYLYKLEKDVPLNQQKVQP